TFSKSKINAAAPRNRSPKRGQTLRRNRSKKKHKVYKSAGSPVSAQRLTSRLSERIPLFISHRLLVLAPNPARARLSKFDYDREHEHDKTAHWNHAGRLRRDGA